MISAILIILLARKSLRNARPLAFIGLVMWLVQLLVLGIQLVGVNDLYAAPGNVQTFLPTDDTYVLAGQPDSTRGSFNNLWIGYRPDQNVQTLAVALKFDLSQVPSGSQISSAELILYMFQHEDDVSTIAAIETRSIRNNDAWNENNLTWNLYQNDLDFANSISSTILLEDGQHGVDVTQIVQDSLQNDRSTIGVAIEMPAIDAQRRSTATFWSKEYRVAEQRPRLVVNYTVPTPTPTYTATATPTATPTPGPKTIILSNDPDTALDPGDVVDYTIDLVNGPYPLSSAIVTNTVPGDLRILENSVQEGSLNWSGLVEGKSITWTLNADFPENASDQLSFRAQRPTPTPESTPPATLLITKSGPDYVQRGDSIDYVLTITDHAPITYTDLTITDTLPAKISIIDPGGGSIPPGPKPAIVWREPTLELATGDSISKTFSLAALSGVSEIVNHDYRIEVMPIDDDEAEPITIIGTDPITTTIGDGPLPDGNSTLTNAGACIRWEYKVPGQPYFSGRQCSGPVFNPSTHRYLPVIAR